jgi:ABC-2 type transport system permease protein
MGAGFLVVGVVFAGVTAVTTQVSENNRVAGGLAGAALGAAFVLRAVGDIGDGTLSWLSPIGWAQKLRPYAGEAWWTLLVPLLATAALAALATRLASRRDFGGGLVAPRPGPRAAAPNLGSPTGLAVRLDRGTVLWWSVGVAVMGATYGSLTQTIDDWVSDNQSLKDLIARSGGASLVDAFLGTSMLIIALIAGGYAVQSVLRPRGEESSGRAEAVLATRVSRAGWLGASVAVTAAGSAVVLAVGALGIGVAAAIATGDAGLVPRLLGAGLAYLPAMWVLLALGVLLHGVAPRIALGLWAVLTGCFVIGFFKQLLGIPTWLADLSPFEHTPRLPAASLDLVPLVVLTLVAAALAAAGLAGFRHRDIGA